MVDNPADGRLPVDMRSGDRQQRGSPSGARVVTQRHTRALDAFGAQHRSARECVQYLEEQGLTRGQARNAVYRYRKEKGMLQSRQKPMP